MEKSVKIEFTESEFKRLVDILDLTVKAYGLSVASESLYFANKLNSVYMENSQEKIKK